MVVEDLINIIKQKRDEYDKICESYFKNDLKRSEAPYYYTKMRTAEEILLAVETFINKNQ